MSNDSSNKPSGTPEDFWNPQPAAGQQPRKPAQQPTSTPETLHEIELVELEPQPAAPVAPAPSPAAAPPTPGGTPASGGGVVCNHCGHKQASGKLCDACGLRIDAPGALLTEEESPELAPGASRINMGDEENPWILCSECGVPNRPEQTVCRNCQALLIKREIY